MEESRQNLNNINIVMIIILLLVIVLLVLIILSRHSDPGIPMKQRAQFNSISAGIELFNARNNSYPPSEALDPTGQPYCGAMKLCEAIMGLDLLGFHPDSIFRADGMDATGTNNIYLPTKENLKARLGPLLQFENANVHKLSDIYGLGNTGPFDEDALVICDTYQHNHWTGLKAGMPILYYKANTPYTEHDVNNPDNPENIYNYKDNYALVGLGVSWEPGAKHPLFTKPMRFYKMTKNWEVSKGSRPHREDSYILISAGKDGLYGTPDDICNFQWKYRK